MPASSPNSTNKYQRIVLLFLLLTLIAVGFMVFLLVIFLIVHATAVPTVKVDSASSHFLFNSTHARWNLTINLMNPSFVAAVKHTNVKASLHHDQATYGDLKVSLLPSFVVKPKKKAVLRAKFKSALRKEAKDCEPMVAQVTLTTHRCLGFGSIWIVAFNLDVLCDHLIFVDPTDNSPSPHGGGGGGGGGDGGCIGSGNRSIMSGNVPCSISSFFVYV